MGEDVEHSPNNLPLMVELCELCETAWPPATLVTAFRVDVTTEIRICPDCVEELMLKERKAANNIKKRKKT